MSYYQDSLFSEEEITGQKNLFSDTENDDSQKASEPVTCLGMTFANDDERRSYFRAELRKKLPELRHIEGFPIGSDDDIINLSDPPYYTACPNPWLNDFIAEWEEEKKQLEAEGKRSADFEVTEPYAANVSEGKSNPIYNAHSYHTKVPHPAIMRYMMHYTQPGDVIIDAFAGTGMTGVAGTFCSGQEIESKNKITDKTAKWGKRNVILSDLSPVASLICSVYNSPLSRKNIFDKIKAIILSVEKEYGWLYNTKNSFNIEVPFSYIVYSDIFICRNCGERLNFYELAVNHDDGSVKDEFKCPHCSSICTKKNIDKAFESHYDYVLGEPVSMQSKEPVLVAYNEGRKLVKKPISSFDKELIIKAEQLSSSFSYVKNRMMQGSEARRNDRQGITHVHQFYFNRSLIIIDKLLSLCSEKEMRFLINSQLINISKLNRYRPSVSFPYNPLSGTLYISSQICEANIFVALKNKLAKLEAIIPLINSRNVTSVNSATQIPLADNSIDYIFTDPPFGANFSYSELNYIQESWLRITTNIQEEAIVNNSHNKSLEDYHSLMTKSLKEYFRVLKPGKWITIEFSNTSASVWNAIQNALQIAGFVITNVAALDKQQGSFKAVTTTTAVKQDLVITCYKPSDELTEKFKTSEDLAMNVWDFVEELLCHLPVHLQKGNKTTAVVERSPKILFDRVISYYVQHGYPVPMNAADFQRGLRERFVERDGMFFTAEQSLEYDTKRAQTESYEAAQSMFVGSEAEGIEWLKRELVEPKTYQDLQPEWMQALVQTKKGDNLPELKQILEENFLKDDNGRWYKPDPEKEADLEKVRARELARNFKAYVEMASTPKGKIKEARLEALRFGFRECYKEKDFATIVKVAQRLPEALVMEDDVLLQFYDIAINRV